MCVSVGRGEQCVSKCLCVCMCSGARARARVCVCVTVCVCVCARAHARMYVCVSLSPPLPQWGAADAEIKVPSCESTELKRSPFKARNRSGYSHTCYTYCQGFLPCLFPPFWSIHLHFFKTSHEFSCVGCG